MAAPVNLKGWAGVIQQTQWRIHVHCPDPRCGYRNSVEDPKQPGAEVWLICHGCELPLTVLIPGEA